MASNQTYRLSIPQMPKRHMYGIIAITGVPGTIAIALPVLASSGMIRAEETPWLVDALLIALGLWFLHDPLQAMWRVMDRQPELVADQNSVQFHPSVGLKSIPWTAISSVRQVMARDRPAGSHIEIEFQLSRRIVSFAHPLGTQKIRVGKPFFHDDEALANALPRIRELQANSG